jgi:hypothetical protein
MNITIKHVEKFLCFRKIKYVACGVSISTDACSHHINEYHFRERNLIISSLNKKVALSR